jgi:hypothetical protein
MEHWICIKQDEPEQRVSVGGLWLRFAINRCWSQLYVHGERPQAHLDALHASYDDHTTYDVSIFPQSRSRGPLSWPAAGQEDDNTGGGRGREEGEGGGREGGADARPATFSARADDGRGTSNARTNNGARWLPAVAPGQRTHERLPAPTHGDAATTGQMLRSGGEALKANVIRSFGGSSGGNNGAEGPLGHVTPKTGPAGFALPRRLRWS